MSVTSFANLPRNLNLSAGLVSIKDQIPRVGSRPVSTFPISAHAIAGLGQSPALSVNRPTYVTTRPTSYEARPDPAAVVAARSAMSSCGVTYKSDMDAARVKYNKCVDDYAAAHPEIANIPGFRHMFPVTGI